MYQTMRYSYALSPSKNRFLRDSPPNAKGLYHRWIEIMYAFAPPSKTMP